MVESRANGIIVHQALHGYRHGHRLLSASTKLDADSDAQLLAMTDLLTSDPFVIGESYLSGYPVKSCNMYVISRTWLAEGIRPGAVWTHSLLLDYSCLSAIDDLMILLALFRKPTFVDDLEFYSKPMIVKSVRGQVVDPHASVLIDDPRVPRVLHHLYGPAALKRFAVPASRPVSDEALAVALWRQMWPGMRRDFAFFTKSTSALADISAAAGLCFSTDPVLVSPFERRVPMTTEAEAEGYAELMRDLPRRGPTRLRRFLGRYAYGAVRPRSAVPAIAAVFAERRDPGGALSTFQRLLGSYPGIDRLKRALLLACIDDRENADSILRALQIFGPEPSFVKGEVLEDALSRTPVVGGRAAALLMAVDRAPNGSVGDLAFTAFVRQLPLRVLAEQATAATRTRMLILRPEVSSQPEFWSVARDQRMALVHKAIELAIDGSILLEGMGGRLSSEEARELLCHAPTLATSIYSNIQSGKFPLHSAAALADVPDVLAEIVDAQLPVSWEVLECIALVHTKRKIVGDSSDWWALSERSPGSLGIGYPYVIGQMFLAGLDSCIERHLSLCEKTFDLLWTLGESHDYVFVDLKDMICSRSPLTTELVYADILIGAVWNCYRNVSVGRVMAVSGVLSRLGRVARYVRSCDGERGLRAIARALPANQNCLQLPLSLVEATLNDAMPLFSAKLPRSPK